MSLLSLGGRLIAYKVIYWALSITDCKWETADKPEFPIELLDAPCHYVSDPLTVSEGLSVYVELNCFEKFPFLTVFLCPCPGAITKAVGVRDPKKTTRSKDCSSFAGSCFSRSFLQNPGGVYDSLGTKLAICTSLSVMKKAGMGKISTKSFHQVSKSQCHLSAKWIQGSSLLWEDFLRDINNFKSF